jgi:hypothetical protein
MYNKKKCKNEVNCSMNTYIGCITSFEIYLLNFLLLHIETGEKIYLISHTLGILLFPVIDTIACNA